jgi:hypothetical protein
VESGDPSPAGPTYSTFAPPLINNSGRVAFTAFINAGFDNSSVLVTQTSTGFQLQARSDSPAPGTEATTVYTGSAQRLSYDDDGRVAFSSTVEGPSDAGSEFGVWSSNPGPPPGTVTLFARENKTAIGVPSATYTLENSSLVLHQTKGGFVMLGDTTGGSAIWRTATATANALGNPPIAREGAATPGISGGVYATLDKVAANVNARVAFTAGTTGTGIDDSNDRAIFTDGAGGAMTLAARENALAGVGPGVFYDFFYDPAINNLGKLAFAADIRGTGVIGSEDPGVTNNQGIWRTADASTSLVLVARAGAAAPGTGTDVLFDRGFERVRIGLNQKVSFVASLSHESGAVTAANDTGVWGSLSGTLNLVAREGSQAPGLAPGVVFGTFKPQAGVEALVTANNEGQVAFKLSLTGTNVNPDNDTTLWAQRPDGVLALIAREGDMWQVGVGDLREVVNIGFDPGDPGNQFSDGWNDLSQIAFTLEFLDNSSGIFVVQVPEPGAASLLFVGATLLGLRPRRRS